MEIITDVAELLANLATYADTAPEPLKTRLDALRAASVDADVLTQAAPLLYAHKADLDDPGRTIMGQLYQYGIDMRWSAHNEQNQSDKIVLAVRRDLGEVGDFPAPEDDPAPNPAFVPAEPPDVAPLP